MDAIDLKIVAYKTQLDNSTKEKIFQQLSIDKILDKLPMILKSFS